MATYTYHFSYDAENFGIAFNGDYQEAKRFLICLLVNTGAEIESYVASTLVLKYSNPPENFSLRLVNYLHQELSTLFNFLVTRVRQYDNSTDLILKAHQDNHLKRTFARYLRNLDCTPPFAGRNFNQF